ncbi:Protein of unknown function [Insolitispirillum peregrinum]|uniref:Mu-like prophage protein gp16 n=2 Tax=Insolitispirillum peregrinum TaxID=80876 RepID=A0A1N7LTF0_9PROT|nr:Protein of unknown function [Insolitispirillum peregrinum]
MTMDRAKAMRQIHALRRKITGLDDDTAWRALLARHGSDSLRAMTDAQIGTVARTLSGMVPRTNTSTATRAQLAKLSALGRAKGWGADGDVLADPAMLAFVRRTAHVDHPRWLTVRQASDCITGLERWQT